MGETYMTKKTKVVGSLSAVVVVLVVTLVMFVFGSDSTSAPDETTTSTTPIETKLLYGSVPVTWPIRLGSIRIYEDGTAKYDSLAENLGWKARRLFVKRQRKTENVESNFRGIQVNLKIILNTKLSGIQTIALKLLKSGISQMTMSSGLLMNNSTN